MKTTHAKIHSRARRPISICIFLSLIQFGIIGLTAQEADQESLDEDARQAILERHGKRDARVHDPSSIVRCDGDYWFFSTGRGVRSWRSKDMLDWERGPQVMEAMPDWVREVVPDQRGHYWAPDVIHHKDVYWLYYSVSKFGVNTSAIALATNPTLNPDDPDFVWTDRGIVIQSERSDDFNAIDPAVVKDESGRLWMSFGSYWSGIQLIELDPETGKRLDPKAPLRRLAHYRAIEAPHIYPHGDYYYLFVNWDRCCRGVESTYNIRVGRSKDISGPYIDKEGRDMSQGGGTLLLETEAPFIGPGHANIFEEDGTYWFSCHFYDGTRRGAPTLAVRKLSWGADGWPLLK